MRLKTFIQLLVSILSTISFGFSIWNHNVNWFAFSTTLYSLAYFLENITEEN